MTDKTPSALIVEVNEASFVSEIEQSSIPVFVDFWAPWCAPCTALAPLFEDLSKIYGDQIKFAKVNIDDNKEIAHRLGIRSIPTLQMHLNGRVVERVLGSRPRTALCSLLDKYVKRGDKAESVAASQLRAFQGDSDLREEVLQRVRRHIDAQNLVPISAEGPVGDEEKQRYSLMGAAAGTADGRRFEEVLAVPASVGRLQEGIHSLLLRQSGEGEDKRYCIDPPYSALPLEWWQSIAPGVDLRALPLHFIKWLLRDLIDNAPYYGVELTPVASSVLQSLIQLYVRASQGGTVSADEWEAVRTTVGAQVRLLEVDAADWAALAAFTWVDQIAWSAEQPGDTLIRTIGALLQLVIQATPPEGYSPAEWSEQKKQLAELMDRAEKATQERFPGLTYDQRQGMRAEIDGLPEVQAQRALHERIVPVIEAHRAKLSLSVGKHMHAGLMHALNDTVSGV